MTKTNYALGMEGQQLAEAHLHEKNYRILARNYRINSGEIDLIAQHNTTLVFIEVKTRQSTHYGTGRESVTPHKQRQIIRTALHYATRHQLTESDMRFDVIEVTIQQEKKHLEHIENAFWA